MIDHPGMVQAVHDDYFAAGASLATTNTYALHHDRFINFGLDHRFLDFYEAALSEAEAARAKHGRGLLAGSMGPLVASYRPETLPPHAEAVAKYAEVAAIMAPRVDLLIGETVASLAHARALVEGAQQGAPGKPLWLSVTVEDRGGAVLRSGESVAEATVSGWHKSPGDTVSQDEILAELETEMPHLVLESISINPKPATSEGAKSTLQFGVVYLCWEKPKEGPKQP